MSGSSFVLNKRDGQVLALEGTIDASNVIEFEKQLVADVGLVPQRWVLDCRKLEFISSAGIGVFLALQGRLEAGQGGVDFVNVPPEVLRTFEILGLDRIFKMTRLVK